MKHKFTNNTLYKIVILILFWIIWFSIYSILNSRGAKVGIHWTAPNIYIPFMVYPYVFGIAILVILPWLWNWKSNCFYRMLSIYIISSIIIFLIYYFYPVYMLRRAYEGPLLADFLMRWIIGMDDPANCFPSNHCMIATLGFLGVKFSRAPSFIKWLTALVTIIVCLSTVLVGQHYWIDIPAGILLSCVVFLIISFIKSPHGASK